MANNKLYSVLERHNDGAWWYHCGTFSNRKWAEEYLETWIPFDKDRPKMVFEHTKPLPQQSCCTKNFKTFEFGGVILWREE